MEEPKAQIAVGRECQVPRLENLPRLSASLCGVVLLGLGACWIGAGSVGLLTSPLRHALLAGLLGSIVLLGWPKHRGWAVSSTTWAKTAGVALIVLLFGFDSHPVLNLLAVVLVLAGLATLQEGRSRTVLTSLSLAGLGLVGHRLALLTVPTYWHLADWVGSWLGRVGGTLAGQPLEVGATFAGLDFLVLSGAWCAACWACKLAVRWSFVWLLGAILAGHLVYLVVLSWAPIWRDHLPPAPPRPEYHVYLPPAWSWSEALRSVWPWSLPWLAMGIHLTILGLSLRWTPWPEAEVQESFSDSAKRPAPLRGGSGSTPVQEIALEAGPVLLAILWPVLTVFWGTPGHLSGKKILAYAPNPQEWTRPAPDRFARDEIGRFGMLPEWVASLQGQWIFSTQLTENQLQQADVVLLVGDLGLMSQVVLETLQQYVESGGALLVASSWPRHPSPDRAGVSVQEMLSVWGIDLRCETAVPALGEWWEGLEPVSHPASLGMPDKKTFHRGACVGLAGSGTLDIRWPVAPVVVGVWGYGDPGREGVRTDFLPQYERGERLGDLVLGAEIRSGAGRVFVSAAPDCFLNENLPSSYLWAARVLAYLAHRGGAPLDWWRQMLSLVAALALLGLIAFRPQAPVQATTTGVLGLMLLAGWWSTQQAGRVLPGGTASGRFDSALSGSAVRVGLGSAAGADSAQEGSLPGPTSPRGLPLAYIDASHMEAYSLQTWSPDGLGRLFVTLVQCGYLPVLAPEISEDRLQTASVWISIAPARRFSSAEQSALKEYVQNGGIFVAMAGAEDANALRPLIEDWGVRIPRSPVAPGESEPEAEPIGQSPGPGESADNYGRLRTYYLDAQDYGRGDYMLAVTLYAPWPVEADAPEADLLVRGYEDVPIAIHRRIGGGSVAVIGDTYFATNKNFDETEGLPSATVIENAHFWRWLLSRLARQEAWIPPDPRQWEDQFPPEEFPMEEQPLPVPRQTHPQRLSPKDVQGMP